MYSYRISIHDGTLTIYNIYNLCKIFSNTWLVYTITKKNIFI